MSWVKRTDTQETSKFWSHVQSVAERVRTSEIYANNRLPKDCSHAVMGRQIDVVYGMGSAEPMRDLHAGRNHRIAALKLSVRCCEEIDWEI